MTEVNPEWPVSGQKPWDGQLVAGLDQIVDAVNGHDQQLVALPDTYVTFLNHDLTPVTGGKHVLITLTADGTDIDNIQVVTP